MKKKKRKHSKKNNNNIFFKQKLDELKNSINNFSNSVPLNNIFINKQIIDTKSFYDMNIYDYNIKDLNNYTFNLDIPEIPDKIYKCIKVTLLPTPIQSKLLLKMMEGYRLVYNLTVKFINNRKYLFNKQKKDIEKKKKEEDELKRKERKNLKLTKEQKDELKLQKQKENEELKLKKEQDKIEKENILKNMSEEEIIEENKKKRIEKISKLQNDNNFDMTLDYKIIRTYFLKNEINKINKEYKTPIHTLNEAVSLACKSFKSAITNQKNGHIKNYRIRQIKSNKNSLMMDIEKASFTKDGKSFIKTILGNKMLNKNEYDYSNIESECKIHYNKNTKKFILLIPEKIEIVNNINNNNYISIDGGLRTFLNCTTNNNYIEIGNNLREKIKDKLIKTDKIEKIKNNKKRNRYLKIIREKIKNQINDTHWKIINYLTSTYKTIVIGKWSTKSIISKENSVLQKMNKRIIKNLSFYKFTERLKYKCMVRNINLKIMDEHYTSKVCTKCGNLKQDLKGESVYNCKECNTSIKRDYNGSRNIFLKSINSINIS